MLKIKDFVLDDEDLFGCYCFIKQKSGEDIDIDYMKSNYNFHKLDNIIVDKFHNHELSEKQIKAFTSLYKQFQGLMQDILDND